MQLRQEAVRAVLGAHYHAPLRNNQAHAFAPTNIAVCKYWGKRDSDLHLPLTSSLSVSVPTKGAEVSMQITEQQDSVYLNGQRLDPASDFVQRIVNFLDLFRLPHAWYVRLEIKMNIPVAAGLASSACGFAALVCGLNQLGGWNLTDTGLSILARLGSGSAARSLWLGFVEWHAGRRIDGSDSYAEPLPYRWEQLYLGILELSSTHKPLSSRVAMEHTIKTSKLYANWPLQVKHDLALLHTALAQGDFALFGQVLECNALTMHATMLSSWPPICYFLPETISMLHKIWELRHNGIPVYVTQDAGPNLKLFFLDDSKAKIVTAFPQLELIKLFN